MNTVIVVRTHRALLGSTAFVCAALPARYGNDRLDQMEPTVKPGGGSA